MNLFGFLTLVTRNSARQRVEQHVLGVLAGPLRKVLVLEPGDECGKRLGGLLGRFLGLRSRHRSLPGGGRCRTCAWLCSIWHGGIATAGSA